jgi:hypothetical protein
MLLLEETNSSMKTTYRYQTAGIKKYYGCNERVGNMNILWPAASVMYIKHTSNNGQYSNMTLTYTSTLSHDES